MKQLIALKRDMLRVLTLDELADLTSDTLDGLELFFVRMSHVGAEKRHHRERSIARSDRKTKRAL